MNWWEELALQVVVGLLHATIKNPGSKKIEASTINTLSELISQAKAALGV